MGNWVDDGESSKGENLDLDGAFGDVKIFGADVLLTTPFLFPVEIGGNIRPKSSGVLN